MFINTTIVSATSFNLIMQLNFSLIYLFRFLLLSHSFVFTNKRITHQTILITLSAKERNHTSKDNFNYLNKIVLHELISFVMYSFDIVIHNHYYLSRNISLKSSNNVLLFIQFHCFHVFVWLVFRFTS